MVFYPVLFPLWIAQADDVAETVTTGQTDSDSTPSSNDSDPVDKEPSGLQSSTESSTDGASAKTAPPAEPPVSSAAADSPASPADNDPALAAAAENTSDPQTQTQASENNCPACSDNDGQCCPQTDVSNSASTTLDNAAAASADTGNNSGAPIDVSTDTTLDPPQPDMPAPASTVADETEADQQPADDHADSQTNHPDQPATDATITTGQATAASAISNEINTNIVSNNYAESVTNITATQVGDIDLSAQFQTLLDNAKQNLPTIDVTVIDNTSEATVNNLAAATATTGNNTLADAKNASLATGNAAAQADIVNIVNTNLVGNTWLLAVINVFGNWVGNLIVPGSDLFTVPKNELPENLTVINENKATVSNNSSTSADTGNNLIEAAQNSSLTTGTATAVANEKNLLNTNIVSNNWFFLLVNNLGHWTGSIIGWDQASGTYENIFQYTFNENPDAPGLTQSFSSLLVRSSNSATVSNTAIASAETGGNSISGAKNANLATGDARAKTDIFNLINTNIVGNNWLLGIVNVMGTWEGDVVFKHPETPPDPTENDPGDENPPLVLDDLDSKLRLERSNNPGVSIATGNIVTHSILVKNSGDDTLYDAKVTDTIKNPEGQKIGSISWNLGKIKKGKKLRITYQLLVSADARPGTYTYSAKGEAHSTQGSEVESNNSRVTLAVFTGATSNQGSSGSGNSDNAFIPVANAQVTDDPGAVLGASNAATPLRLLPLWILLASLLAYFLAINWSEFKKQPSPR